MKRGCAALKTLSASWLQRDNRKIRVDLIMATARDNHKDPHLRHPMVEQMSQLWRNKTAVAGLVIIIVFFLTAIFAPLLSPHDPLETEL